MNRLAAVSALAAAFLGPSIRAQSTEPPAQVQLPGNVRLPECPSTPTLDDLVKALYAAVSGPANQDRTCFRAVFLPDARLMPLVKNKETGAVAPRILTVQDWIDAVAKRGSTTFYEKQVKGTIESWGNEAHLWSTYETRETPDGKPEARGINSIQAVFDGKSWKVISIVWQAESAEQTLPAKYLP